MRVTIDKETITKEKIVIEEILDVDSIFENNIVVSIKINGEVVESTLTGGEFSFGFYGEPREINLNFTVL